MPAIEFTKINRALIADISLIECHPKISKTGLSMIPPPMPIMPAKKPIIPPKTTKIIFFKPSAISNLCLGVKKILIIESNKQTANIFLYQKEDIVNNEPKYAIGMDGILNFKNRDEL